MATGKSIYELTPLAQKMADEKGYSHEPQQKLPPELFAALMKDKDIGTLMFQGGTDLTRGQLQQVRELIKKTPKKKLQEVLKDLEGTVGYQNLLSLPIVSKVLETNKKKTAAAAKPAPVQNKAEEPVEQPAEKPVDTPADTNQTAQHQEQPAAKSATSTATPQLKKKDPNYSNVVAGVLKPLMKGDSAANILGKMYNFMRMEHETYLKNLRDDRKLRKQLETIKENRNAELIHIFSGKKVVKKEEKKADTKGTEPKKAEPTNQTAQKTAPEPPKPTANKVPEAPTSTTGSFAKRVALGAAVGAVVIPSETIAGVIDTASKTVGVDSSIMYAMANQESGFNPNAAAKTSSAKGLFQFIDKTWNSMVSKYGTQYPILKQRGVKDPEANALAGALYIKENSQILAGAGIPINATNIYASHFLGPGGAKKLLTASPTDNASKLLPQAASSNKTIFYEVNGKTPDLSRPRTVAQVIEILYKKVGKSQEKYAAILNDPSLVAENETGDRLSNASTTSRSLKQQAKAEGMNVSVLNNNTNIIGGGTTYQNPEEVASLPAALAKQYKS